MRLWMESLMELTNPNTNESRIEMTLVGTGKHEIVTYFTVDK